MNERQKLSEAYRLFTETADDTLRAAFIDAVITDKCGPGENYLACTAADDDAELHRGSQFYEELTGQEYIGVPW